MAEDIRTLLRSHLHVTDEIVLVGYDIRAIVAISHASHHRDEVSHPVAIDTIVPGNTVSRRLRGDPRAVGTRPFIRRGMWRMLVQGRERVYVQHMIDVRIGDPTAISSEDFNTYVGAYAAPGALRAAFELYRAFDENGRSLEATLSERGKLPTPTFAVGGEPTGLGSVMAEMMREIAEPSQALW